MKNILALWKFYFFQSQGWEAFSKSFYKYRSKCSPVCISPAKDKFDYFTTSQAFGKNNFNTSHVKIPEEFTTLTEKDCFPFLSCTKFSHFYTTAQEKKKSKSPKLCCVADCKASKNNPKSGSLLELIKCNPKLSRSEKTEQRAFIPSQLHPTGKAGTWFWRKNQRKNSKLELGKTAPEQTQERTHWIKRNQ